MDWKTSRAEQEMKRAEEKMMKKAAEKLKNKNNNNMGTSPPLFIQIIQGS